jgi:16S rRNA (guanine527-N7)-methyltransferase
MTSQWTQRMVEDARTLGVTVTEKMAEQFNTYAELLVSFNERVNLTAITDDEGIAIRHFVDSLSAVPLLPHGSSVVDVGTGAGFPGIPFAIVRPDLRVSLADSLDKRVRFLDEVVAVLGLGRVTTRHGRAEELGVDPAWRDQFDVAAARAVAPLPVLLEYCLPLVKPGGVFLAMKGPGATEEAEQSTRALEVLGGRIVEIRRFFLPGTEMERQIVVVKKTGRTPKGYPRKSGKPGKQPL